MLVALSGSANLVDNAIHHGQGRPIGVTLGSGCPGDRYRPRCGITASASRRARKKVCVQPGCWRAEPVPGEADPGGSRASVSSISVEDRAWPWRMAGQALGAEPGNGAQFRLRWCRSGAGAKLTVHLRFPLKPADLVLKLPTQSSPAEVCCVLSEKQRRLLGRRSRWRCFRLRENSWSGPTAGAPDRDRIGGRRYQPDLSPPEHVEMPLALHTAFLERRGRRPGGANRNHEEVPGGPGGRHHGAQKKWCASSRRHLDFPPRTAPTPRSR